MAYGRSESTWDNLGKFIYQSQPKAKTLVRKFERILIKLYKSLLFNQTHIYVCVCVRMHRFGIKLPTRVDCYKAQATINVSTKPKHLKNGFKKKSVKHNSIPIKYLYK